MTGSSEILIAVRCPNCLLICDQTANQSCKVLQKVFAIDFAARNVANAFSKLSRMTKVQLDIQSPEEHLEKLYGNLEGLRELATTAYWHTKKDVFEHHRISPQEALEELAVLDFWSKTPLLVRQRLTETKFHTCPHKSVNLISADKLLSKKPEIRSGV